MKVILCTGVQSAAWFWALFNRGLFRENTEITGLCLQILSKQYLLGVQRGNWVLCLLYSCARTLRSEYKEKAKTGIYLFVHPFLFLSEPTAEQRWETHCCLLMLLSSSVVFISTLFSLSTAVSSRSLLEYPYFQREIYFFLSDILKSSGTNSVHVSNTLLLFLVSSPSM